jgi:ribosome-binding factor A
VTDRMRRVDEAVREVLSDAISHQVKDPRVGFVTVTAVETASDLRHARVFVSVLGDEGARRRSLAGLQSAHGVLQRVVARELRLKHTPTLAFVYDDTSERAARVARLIDASAAVPGPERGGDEASGPGGSGAGGE